MGNDSNTALTDTQVREVDARAELAVRRYFDHHLTEVLPQLDAAQREATDAKIAAHNSSPAAHGGVEARLNKAVWIVCGAAMAGSGGAVGVLKLLGGLGV